MQPSEAQGSAAVSLETATLAGGQCRKAGFMTEDRGQETCATGGHDDRLLWLALLSQAKANHDLSHALLCRTQSMICSDSAYDLEPDC